MMGRNAPKNSINQEIEIDVSQNQNVTQLNESLQGMVVAIAIGEGSKASAVQEAVQDNINEQRARAFALNVTENCSGKCVDQSEEPDVDIAQNQTINQLNSVVQCSAVAISIDGGEASSQQAVTQMNENTQSVNQFADNISPCGHPPYDSSTEKQEQVNTKKPNEKRTSATAVRSLLNERAVIAIDMGGVQLKLQIADNGDVFVNGKKIRSGFTK